MCTEVFNTCTFALNFPAGVTLIINRLEGGTPFWDQGVAGSNPVFPTTLVIKPATTAGFIYFRSYGEQKREQFSLRQSLPDINSMQLISGKLATEHVNRQRKVYR